MRDERMTEDGEMKVKTHNPLILRPDEIFIAHVYELSFIN